MKLNSDLCKLKRSPGSPQLLSRAVGVRRVPTTCAACVWGDLRVRVRIWGYLRVDEKFVAEPTETRRCTGKSQALVLHRAWGRLQRGWAHSRLLSAGAVCFSSVSRSCNPTLWLLCHSSGRAIWVLKPRGAFNSGLRRWGGAWGGPRAGGGAPRLRAGHHRPASHPLRQSAREAVPAAAEASGGCSPPYQAPRGAGSGENSISQLPPRGRDPARWVRSGSLRKAAVAAAAMSSARDSQPQHGLKRAASPDVTGSGVGSGERERDGVGLGWAQPACAPPRRAPAAGRRPTWATRSASRSSCGWWAPPRWGRQKINKK